MSSYRILVFQFSLEFHNEPCRCSCEANLKSFDFDRQLIAITTNLSPDEGQHIRGINFRFKSEKISLVLLGKLQISSKFPNLEDMELIKNYIKILPLNFFQALTKLRYVSLDNNLIEYLPEDIFKNNLNLEEIHLAENKIKYLPLKMFQSLTNLTYLWLSKNLIEDLPSDLFKSNLNLKRIRLDDNKIKIISTNIFQRLTHLNVVWLDKNLIEDLPADLFRSNLYLEKIQLNKNKIKIIPANIFQRLTNLREISLSQNLIEDLPAGLFENNLNLEWIDFDINIYNIFNRNNIDFKIFPKLRWHTGQVLVKKRNYSKVQVEENTKTGIEDRIFFF